MPNVAPLNREELAEFEPVFKLVEQVMGFVPRSMLTMGRRPEILRGFAALMGAVLAGGTVDGSLKQLVAMVSSVTSGCRYCQAHTSHAAHRLGASEEKIAAAFDFESSPLFSDAERAALRLARRLDRAERLHPRAFRGAAPPLQRRGDRRDRRRHQPVRLAQPLERYDGHRA